MLIIKWIKKIFSDTHNAIVSIVVVALVTGTGSIYLFCNNLWRTLSTTMQQYTLLWAAGVLVLVVLVYIYLKTGQTNHNHTSKLISPTPLKLPEFKFIDPPGYYTHPKYSYPLCPSCLIKRNLTSPVSNGYCTVCGKPISETLKSGGAVFTIPDE